MIHSSTRALARPSAAVAVLVLVLATLSCGGPGGTVVLKVAHNGNLSHPYQLGYEAFRDVIERETGGTVEVQIFDSSQLGTEEEASIMVKLGALASSAASAGGGLGPFVPEAELFNLPFLFEDLDHFYRVLDGPVGERVAAAVEERLDAIVLGWWFSGVRNVWNSERPVHSPEDLQGLKIRVMSTPVLVDAFNALGAQATPMSFGELYSGLEQGVVDGAETDHIDLLSERFYEVTRYVSYTEHMYLAAGLLFSRKLYEQLPADTRDAVRLAARESVRVQRAAMLQESEAALGELRELGIEFNPVDRELFRRAVQEVYARNADKVGGLDRIQEAIAQ